MSGAIPKVFKNKEMSRKNFVNCENVPKSVGDGCPPKGNKKSILNRSPISANIPEGRRKRGRLSPQNVNECCEPPSKKGVREINPKRCLKNSKDLGVEVSNSDVKTVFKVDRKRLLAMMQGCPPDPWHEEVMKIPLDQNGRVKYAADFFAEIMEETKTVIKYPKEITSRKDPYISVMGAPMQVNDAVQWIQCCGYLLPQNKVVLRTEIPWNYHSHIIGRGGNTIQPIVKRNGVSVHFPDGNKNSDTLKSNQVSITMRGDQIKGLEGARRSLRDLTPLIFDFSLPIASFVNIEYGCSEAAKIENVYNVKVETKCSQTTLDGRIVGSEWDAERVMEAMHCLLTAFCGPLAAQMGVRIEMEVTAQHHAYITGQNRQGFKNIEKSTYTSISYQEYRTDSGLSLLNRALVVIQGAINNVYEAKQKIMGSIPILLVMDVPSDKVVTECDMYDCSALGVQVFLKRRPIDGKKTVILKTPERNTENLYQAWSVISKCDIAPPAAIIPRSYHLPIELPGQYQYSEDPYLSCVISAAMTSNGEAQQLTAKAFSDAKLDVHEMMDLIVDSSAPGTKIENEEEAIQLTKQRFCDYISKKIQAAQAMREPINSTPRVPTADWAGYGLSKSGPPHMPLSTGVELGSSLNSAYSDSSQGSFDSTFSDSGWNHQVDNFFTFLRKGATIAAPEIFAAALPKLNKSLTRVEEEDILHILIRLGLEQYIDRFRLHDIDFESLLQLNEQDLRLMGVSNVHHRNKMLLAIKNLSSEKFFM